MNELIDICRDMADAIAALNRSMSRIEHRLWHVSHSGTAGSRPPMTNVERVMWRMAEEGDQMRRNAGSPS